MSTPVRVTAKSLIELASFGHDNLKGRVDYKGWAVCFYNKGQWHQLFLPVMPKRLEIQKAVANAIFGLPNKATAEEMRKRIGEELGL